MPWMPCAKRLAACTAIIIGCIGRLFIYIIIAILIGLVLRKPFEQLNHYMERSKENSGVML